MAQPDQSAQILALVNAQAAARERVNVRVLELLTRIWASFSGDGWYDEAAVRAVAAQAWQFVRQGQATTADVTSAYLDQVMQALDTAPPRQVVSLPERPRGIDPVEEWSRPAKEYRRARADGLDEGQSTKRAQLRITQLAADDLDLGMREAARQRFLASSDKVLGYRRVIHPELSRGGTCGLCIAAADRRYKRGDLLPVHGGCRCEVLPIIKGRADPGQVFNGTSSTELYRRVLAASGEAAANALKNTRVTVTEHGELGPVLHDRSHRFRTQAAADAGLRNPGDAA